MDKKLFVKEVLLKLAESNRSSIKRVFAEIMQIAEEQKLFVEPKKVIPSTPTVIREVEIEDEE